MSVPSIYVKDGNILTDSRAVGTFFSKRHDNVMQGINSLLAQAPSIALNFQAVEYRDLKGELRPAYEMTRDGFTLLTMGFNGTKALAFKLRCVRFRAGTTRALSDLSVPFHDRVLVLKSTVCHPHSSPFPNRGALFLTRAGVHQMLMASKKPAAVAFRAWLANEVVPSISDTGGYLLNEAARETAKATCGTPCPCRGRLRVATRLGEALRRLTPHYRYSGLFTALVGFTRRSPLIGADAPHTSSIRTAQGRLHDRIRSSDGGLFLCPLGRHPAPQRNPTTP